MAKYVPLFAAVLSAVVLLFGYVYDKRKQREFEVTKQRQEVYERLIRNATSKLQESRRLLADSRMPKRVTEQNQSQVQALIKSSYPKLQALMDETPGIMAFLAVYGTDQAIKAVARFYREGLESIKPGSSVTPDVGKLMLDLRRSLFADTKVTAKDINLILSD